MMLVSILFSIHSLVRRPFVFGRRTYDECRREKVTGPVRRAVTGAHAGVARQHAFAAERSGEVAFDGFMIPLDLRCSWHGDDFIWFAIDEAIFR
ncbi:hypothetical protein AB0B45_32115 [Nonomuraea sp. NPDC049152]|uniref:hypothetical protein n=1 Tax=Nonomuraea sp. NPDC049152 TaxID=3154350 RepID=UPI0034094157